MSRTADLPVRRLPAIEPDLLYDNIGTVFYFERERAGRITGLAFRMASGGASGVVKRTDAMR